MTFKVKTLVEKLNAGREDEQILALTDLAYIGSEANIYLEEIINAIKNSSEEIKTIAMGFAFREITENSPLVLDYLIDTIEHESSINVRKAAIDALCYIRPISPNIISLLIDKLECTSLRECICYNLLDIGIPSIGDTTKLISVLKDEKDEGVRAAILQIIMHIPNLNRVIIPQIVDYLRDPNIKARIYTCFIVLKIDDTNDFATKVLSIESKNCQTHIKEEIEILLIKFNLTKI